MSTTKSAVSKQPAGYSSLCSYRLEQIGMEMGLSGGGACVGIGP